MLFEGGGAVESSFHTPNRGLEACEDRVVAVMRAVMERTNALVRIILLMCDPCLYK